MHNVDPGTLVGPSSTALPGVEALTPANAHSRRVPHLRLGHLALDLASRPYSDSPSSLSALTVTCWTFGSPAMSAPIQPTDPRVMTVPAPT